MPEFAAEPLIANQSVVIWPANAHAEPPKLANVINVMVDPAGLIVTFGFASPTLVTGNAELDRERQDDRGVTASVVARILIPQQAAESTIRVFTQVLREHFQWTPPPAFLQPIDVIDL